jgi:hypothetical protein
LPSNLPSSDKLVYFVKIRSGNSSTGRDIATGILHDLQPVFGGEASTAPNNEKTFLNDVSILSAATDGYLAVQSNPEFAGTVLAAYPVFVRVSHFISVRSFGNEHHRPEYQRNKILDRATLGAEAARKLPTIIYRLSCARESNQLANRRIDTILPTLKLGGGT